MKSALFCVVATLSLSACAEAPKPAPAAKSAAAVPAAPAADTPDARAIQAIRVLNAQVAVERVGPAPLPGFREAIVGGQVVYVSDDGQYLFLPGALFDTRSKKNLSEISLAGMRKQALKAIPAAERIVFAPANPKYTVSVFTDVECGYCRKLHSEIAEYNRQGIAIEYYAFPRAGIGSQDYNTMVSVWCAPDRRKALGDAKSGRAVPSKNCKNSLTLQYEVGQHVGVGRVGTPTLLAADGTQLGGYVPPAALRATLDKMAADGSFKPAATGPVDAVPAATTAGGA